MDLFRNKLMAFYSIKKVVSYVHYSPDTVKESMILSAKGSSICSATYTRLTLKRRWQVRRKMAWSCKLYLQCSNSS